MSDPLRLQAAAPWASAITAIHDLLTRLRIEHLFVGGAGEAAWTGSEVSGGTIDVLAALAPERKSQVPMMASNNGFIVDRDAVEAADELDLIPLGWNSDGQVVRIHVLVASNALYGRMFRSATTASFGEGEVGIPAAEDVVLMMLVGERSREAIDAVVDAAGGAFDRARLNDKLRSIGLPGSVL